jgi:sulfate adenylyltransferase subunit 1
VAINKMDLVEYSSSRFKEIREEFLRSLPQLGHEGVEFVPLCALHGDCVVFRGEKLGWYDGPPLLDLLETIPLAEDSVGADFRFQVQLVLRGEGITRHYAGAIVSGEVRAGDEVQILPSGTKTRVRAVHAWPDRPDYAKAPLSVALELEDDRDVSRGDLIASVTSSPAITQYLSLWACWMRNRSLKKGDRVLVSQGYRESKAVVDSIECIVDMQDLKHVTAPAELAFNDVGLISLRLAKPMAMEAYAANRSTGALILVDEISGATVGAGMIEKCLSPREI